MTPTLAPPVTSASPAQAAPLAGVRVLDLTRLLPGPMCTLHLADLGAEVIKIEDTGAGDYAAPAVRELVNRNKLGLRLDLKQPAGLAVLQRLAREADVLVEGFRPGVMARLGAGYPALAAINPRLVYCSLTGYGQTGPLRDAAGHDLNYAGLAGVAEQIGQPGQPPALSNVPVADLLGGSMTAVMGILAALFDAQRTGLGRHVDIAVADGVLAHAVLPLAVVNTQGRTSPVGQGKLTGALPCYAVYTAACGGHLAVAALEKKFWDLFCQHIGRPEWQARHQPVSVAGCEQLRAELQALIGSQPLAWWAEHLAGVDCCVTPILKLEEALEHPQFQARGMVLQQPEGQRQLACPVRMSGYEFALRQPAPRPGEHTDPVLVQAGYSAGEIEALRAQGAVA
ncbi:MAG: CoA transferase [Curvibacter lanceolatus]|uniref:CaiB/BaiF CoA transferase family protein n=1 Tax=Curvibacter lanceolatus TaxID=86182 RepID=UPI002355B86C|nr:CaiB/BaiF CoA-transferase family protein [Curvibacter lanceolatus]MBV5294473.1 CoA transferase [Curvibacter lanceolatus]